MFSVEEVFFTILELSWHNVLGLVGFSFAFLQFSWDFVKEKVMRHFREFHKQGRFAKCLNAILLVLVW